MKRFRIRWLSRDAYIRIKPWAWVAPLAVLGLSIGLLQFRRPGNYSDNERARLATVQELVEHQTLAIDQASPFLAATSDKIDKGPSSTPGRRYFSKQPPTLAFLLSGSYWVLHQAGLNIADPADMRFLFELFVFLSSILPVAIAAGLIYRMARLFDLPRPWRCLLAIATICASGLISYTTALNSHAPAAALVIAACACFLHISISDRATRTGAWLLVAGACAGLAAVIDMAAIIFLVLLVPVVLVMPWRNKTRLAGVALYVLGAIPALLLHALLTIQITGDVAPGFLHSQLIDHPAQLIIPSSDNSDEEAGPSSFTMKLGQCVDALLGSHGLLSHFPFILIGLAGVFMILRRHWPIATKTLACITVISGLMIIGAYLVLNPDWTQPMFAVRWFVVFVPLVIFWAGAWMRRSHHPATWIIAGVLLSLSILISLLGATNPFIDANGQYTAYSEIRHLFSRS